MNKDTDIKPESGQLKMGVILNYLNLALGGLIPFFYTPIMLRLLGQQEYGLYKLSSSITSYLGLMSLGLGAAITRYLIKARTESGKEEEQKVLGLFVVIFRIISLLTLVVGVALVFSIRWWYTDSLTPVELNKMRVLIFLLACNTVVNFIATPYIAIVNAHERFLFLQSMNIFSTCAGPILNLIALYLGYASIGLAVSTLAATVVFRIFYYVYVQRYMDIRPMYKKLPMPFVKEILIFSFWIFVSNVVGQLYDTTDTVLIGAIPQLATVGVAVYSIGITFNSMIFSVNAGLSSLLVPKANKMVFGGASNDEITDHAIKYGRIQCFIISLFVFGFIAFGRPFIHFYVGDAYQEGYWIAVVCMVPNTIPLIQSFFLNVLIARNHNRFRALIYLLVAVLNVVGTWILLNIIGIFGAALMTGLAMLVGHVLIMNWFYRVKMGMNIRRFWAEMGRVVLVPLLLCALALGLSRWVDFYRLTVLLAGIVSFTLVYLVCSWKWVMNDFEKSAIKSLVRR